MLGDGDADDLGGLVPHVEVALGAAPDGEGVVAVPHGGGAVGLDVPLVHGGGVELPLDHEVGVPEALVGVADLEDEVVGDVADLAWVVVGPEAPGAAAGLGHGQQAVVEQGRVVLHGVQHVHDGREHRRSRRR